MKSHVSLPISILESVFIDASRKCYTVIGPVHWERDWITILSRIKHEGLSFLTITLPDFGKAFEKALDRGQVDPTQDFQGWKRRGCLPAFLSGFTGLVFDRTGKVKEDADVSAVEAVRQIAYCFKKLQLSCSREREIAAINAYLDCEAGFETFSEPEDIDTFLDISQLIWGNLFYRDFCLDSLIPKHGPGATEERIRGNSKYVFRTWHERLQPYFPMDSYVSPSIEGFMDQRDHVKVVLEEQEQPVRVVLVPKTLKTPRVIAIEPVCMQYTQQALARYIIPRLEGSGVTAGHINFTNQRVNQELALISSQTGHLATLDLSEASDRVPSSLVYAMLSSVPDLRDAIFACRSRRAQLPDGRIVPLSKFASMGSALCFPIEAMYFFTVITLALLRKAGLPVTNSSISKVTRDVYVYGDDIIVPVDAVDVVIGALQRYNCKVNAGKSFWTGKFRESCGVDAYDGEVVTPTYVRRVPDGKVSPSDLLSWIATSNLFYKKGYWMTSTTLKDVVERVTGKLPLVLETSAGQGWFSYQGGYSVHRWSVKLHRYEVRTLIASPSYMPDPLDDWPALLKFFLTSMHRGPLDIVDEEHLRRSPRYGTVSMKRRWTTPY